MLNRYKRKYEHVSLYASRLQHKVDEQAAEIELLEHKVRMAEHRLANIETFIKNPRDHYNGQFIKKQPVQLVEVLNG